MSKIQFRSWLGKKEFNLKLLNQFQLFPMQKFSFPSNFDENWRFFILQLFSFILFDQNPFIGFFFSLLQSPFLSRLKRYSPRHWKPLETDKTIKKIPIVSFRLDRKMQLNPLGIDTKKKTFLVHLENFLIRFWYRISSIFSAQGSLELVFFSF